MYVVSDIRSIRTQLPFKKRFDLILIDPPWENKHVKRTLKRRKIQNSLHHDINLSSNTYEMLDNDTIESQLPITEILKNSGTLVIYCTNSRKHQVAIEKWLKHWQLTHVTTWLWLKVTNSGSVLENNYGLKIIRSLKQ